VLTALNPTNTTLGGTPQGDDWLVERDATDTSKVDVFLNGNLIWSTTIDPPSTLTIDGLAGNDKLTVDYVRGNPVPMGGLVYNGGADTDTLVIQGNATDALNTVIRRMRRSAATARWR